MKNAAEAQAEQPGHAPYEQRLSASALGKRPSRAGMQEPTMLQQTAKSRLQRKGGGYSSETSGGGGASGGGESSGVRERLEIRAKGNQGIPKTSRSTLGCSSSSSSSSSSTSGVNGRPSPIIMVKRKPNRTRQQWGNLIQYQLVLGMAVKGKGNWKGIKELGGFEEYTTQKMREWGRRQKVYHSLQDRRNEIMATGKEWEIKCLNVFEAMICADHLEGMDVGDLMEVEMGDGGVVGSWSFVEEGDD